MGKAHTITCDINFKYKYKSKNYIKIRGLHEVTDKHKLAPFYGLHGRGLVYIYMTSSLLWRCLLVQRSRLIPLSVSPNNHESGKQSLYPDGYPDRHRNLTICSLTHCQPSLKISCKSFGSFCAKLLRQTDKQTI